MDLFSSVDSAQLPGTPLAERMRPRSIDDWIGQPEVIRLFKSYIKNNFLPNLILWGPPGSGKTTFAKILSRSFNFRFKMLNAVEVGVKSIRDLGEEARQSRTLNSQRTVIFVDEIHRMNQAQQDVFLPYMESGDFSLIGATTENPFFDLNRALQSRSKVIQFRGPTSEDLLICFQKALAYLEISESAFCDLECRSEIIQSSTGDYRVLLGTVEHLHFSDIPNPIKKADYLNFVSQFRSSTYFNESLHSDLVSAFIKSIRGSDPDAALYYLANLIKSEASLMFLARRLVILASEDVGNADPRALTLAVSCQQAVDFVGMPESAIILAQTVCYLASAPKSNRSYLAIQKALQFVETSPCQKVPPFLKNQGADGKYVYPHDFPKSWTSQSYWPYSCEPQNFYEPSSHGFEKNIKDFLNWLKS
jgi:putative ATPase